MIKQTWKLCGKCGQSTFRYPDQPCPWCYENLPPEENHGGSTDYYKLPEDAKDLQDLIEEREMNFAIGNIFKAAYRLGRKGDPLYDLNKIVWFAQREIERLS